MSRANKGREDPSDLSAMEVAGLSLFDLYKPYPWAKAVPEASAASFEDQAVSQFFERYVMYPSNDGSSPGFLEYLPVLFEEVNVERRLALRWAVRAAAYANLSSDHSLGALKSKALHCYGLALSALAESLADTRTSPDDYILMTVVVLDLFEVSLIDTCHCFPVVVTPDISRLCIYMIRYQRVPTPRVWHRFCGFVVQIKFTEHVAGAYSVFHTIVW